VYNRKQRFSKGRRAAVGGGAFSGQLSVFSVAEYDNDGHTGSFKKTACSGSADRADAADLPVYFCTSGNRVCHNDCSEIPSGKPELPDKGAGLRQYGQRPFYPGFPKSERPV